MRGTRHVVPALVPVLLLSACALARGSSAPPRPSAREAWPGASVVAAEQVAAGRYATADRWLADFVAQYPGTREATSATVRRALYMADPANQSATAHGATLLLDSALTTSLDSASRTDVRAMRRITLALERTATREGAANPSNASNPGSDVNAHPEDIKAHDDEVQRLKNELAKANAELERIKKRVAAPKP